MHTLVLDMDDAYWGKLQALAAARNRTEVQCLLDFIRACQPGGSGWRPPEQAKKLGEARAKVEADYFVVVNAEHKALAVYGDALEDKAREQCMELRREFGVFGVFLVRARAEVGKLSVGAAAPGDFKIARVIEVPDPPQRIKSLDPGGSPDDRATRIRRMRGKSGA